MNNNKRLVEEDGGILRQKVGNNLQIQCYKHDGKVHCAWSEAVIIEENEEYLICSNNKSLVIEADGRTWRTREPAIMYFFKKRWFNIIAQLKEEGVSYYCNIATPYIIEENTIKYIDYDLDLRIFPSGSYKVLDRLEYNYHKKIMNYSDELDVAIKKGLDDLIQLYKKKSKIFDAEQNLKYYEKYKYLEKNR